MVGTMMYKYQKSLSWQFYVFYNKFPAVASAGKVNTCSVCSDVMQGGTAGC